MEGERSNIITKTINKNWVKGDLPSGSLKLTVKLKLMFKVEATWLQLDVNFYAF